MFWAFIEKLMRTIWSPVTPVPTPIPPTPVPVPVPAPAPTDSASTHLYKVALSFLGKDASPADVAPDEFGCAETVTDIIHAAFGDFPKEGGTIVSTSILFHKLAAHPKFKATLFPQPGDVIVSPTGSGNGRLANGHTGIFAEGEKIMSNDSGSGLFKQNYTFDSWITRYRGTGGFHIYIFHRVGV